MDIKIWCRLFCVIFLICLNVVSSEQPECITGLKTAGYTIPHGDITLEYGQPLDILCVVYSTRRGNSSSIYFKKGKDIISSNEVETVNSTAIRLHVDKPEKTFGDRYNCLLNTNTLVCTNVVLVGVKPQLPTDFECIGYNFENLKCSWTPPENYIRTDYNLTYYLRGRASRGGLTCPNLTIPDRNDPDRRMSCTWSIQTTPSYRQVHKEFFFVLNMTNYLGTNSLNYTLNHFAHVLAGPPDNLTVLSTTPSSIYLYWMVSSSMQPFPPGVHHRILYQCEYGEKRWLNGGLINDHPHRKYIKFNLTDIEHAHALCDIRVSIRSADALAHDEKMWSRNASITVRTSPKLPDHPPKTNIGSFEVVNNGNIQYKEAYVYWQQLSDKERNGPDFGYEVEIEGEPSIQPVENNSVYVKLTGLSISKSYKVNIWSKNSVGRSLQKSSVVIPKQSDRIPEPLRISKIEFGNGTYELSWEPAKSRHKIVNYTLYWCSNDRDRPYQCSGKLYWKEVPSTIQIYNITVDENRVFQFAISANSHNSSSGMLWSTCTILHNKNIGKMKNIWINRLGSTFIEVGWKLDCSDQIGGLDAFIIYYCPIISPMETNCKEPQKNVTFPASNTMGGNITNLTPYTTYMLTVAVKTKHNTYSHESDALYNTTLEAAPSSPPLDFLYVNVTNSSVHLQWKSPVANNGVLKYYVINYKSDNYGVPRELKVEPKFTSIDLTDLDSYVNYSIWIQACTIMCSENSDVLRITTEMGTPGEITQPAIPFQNNTHISIRWEQPKKPRGRNDFYEVLFKEKYSNGNITLPIFNVTESKYILEGCGNNGKYDTFYVSVRAVNVDNKMLYRGPWSHELEAYCQAPIKYAVYVVSVSSVLAMILLGYFGIWLYKHWKIMRKVEIKMPPGLDPVVTDHTLVPWSTEKHPDDRDFQSPADEELLLVKMSEARHLSGDSSGCSSGHESVSSSLETATHISSSSDSGTEQVGSYCVLGVDPKVNALNASPVKTVNPGYVPFTDPIVKNSTGYVVAGLKSDSDYIPFNQTDNKNIKLD